MIDIPNQNGIYVLFCKCLFLSTTGRFQSWTEKKPEGFKFKKLKSKNFEFSLQTIMQTNYAINGLSQLSANNLIVDT